MPESNNLQSLKFSGGERPTLAVLDQLLVPDEKKYIDIPDVEAAWGVIRSMQIRGAPLIAIVALLGLAVDLNSNAKTIAALEEIKNDGDAVMKFIDEKLDYLATSRPTAVNLFNAITEIRGVLKEAKTNFDNDGGSSGSNIRECLCKAVLDHSKFMLDRDVNDNKNIGKFGAQAILKNKPEGKKVTIMTICNTGSLATAGYGTALGVARALQEMDRLESIIALETRPYNQGSRLTAFEIVEEKMPGGILICDSAAGAMMRTREIDAVVVGADRVCANGDTANKIGTYNVSVVAAGHGVPVYVASPFTTLDCSLKDGDVITIEERHKDELISSAKAPPSIDCWNPAFDVTPAKYIAGIITEKGVIRPAVNGTIDVAAFVEKHRNGSADSKETEDGSEEVEKLDVPLGYREQSAETIPKYLLKYAPHVMERFLGTNDPSDISCIEMGDGNLNLVFIVTNTKIPTNQVIVKQALPYVRCVGESWPLTLDRAYFEFKALQEEKEACPEFVPAIYFFSKNDGLLVMEYIAPPAIVLRKGLIMGIHYPTAAEDLGVFCAKTLFKTSSFRLSPLALRKNVEVWSKNSEMCALTEQVVFTEPYIDSPNNRWTTPQLDDDKLAIENDLELKTAAAKLKQKFVTETQALIHADFHTGSVMCAPHPGQTFVIDPEFSFYGPMAFDTGALIANLFLAYVSQDGHDNEASYAEWILEQIKVFWETFTKEFTRLWDNPEEHTGTWYERKKFETEDQVKHTQQDFFQYILGETLGFAGMKMLRRIVGIAHVEDLECIKDADVRARCESHGLNIAKMLIKNGSTYQTIDDALQLARLQKPAVK